MGTFNVLEALKAVYCDHLIFGSTQSIYGGNTKLPYKENAKSDRQLSFYAATKKSCELLTYSYAHLYTIPTTCARFFTVYGP